MKARRLCMGGLAALLLLAHGSASAVSPKPGGSKLARERAAFEALKSRDERGVVKPNGLAIGIMQRKALVARTRSAAMGGGGPRAGAMFAPLAGLTGVSNWTALGPGNIGGRVISMVAHPTTAGKLWVGTAGGGIWVTSNGGASWAPVNDFMGSLTVQSLAIDPNNANTMYAGSGEGYGNTDALRGSGLFKSTDGGVTWSVMPSTVPSATNPNWYYVTKVAVQPGNPLVILAATASLTVIPGSGDSPANGFIYRSTDGGTTWTQVYTSTTNASGNTLWGLAFDPNTATNVAVGDMSGGVAYSTDAGLTWTRSVVAAGAGRVEIAYAKTVAGALYASVDNNRNGGVTGASGQVYKSANGGAAWTLQGTPNHLATQGDYGNAIWVDPANAAHVVAGGLDLWQSSDSGVTWTQISNWLFTPASPHADHHVLVSDFAGAFYDGDDGGVYSAATVTAATSAAAANGWANRNNGLAVTQFYSVVGSTAAAGRIQGGAQDNGALTYTQTGANWTSWNSGDGGISAIDTSDLTGNTFYGEYVYLNLYRTQNGGTNAVNICSGITDANPQYCGAGNVQNANFTAPLILDPNNTKRMLAGGLSLWVTQDATAATPVWSNIYNRAAATAGDFISAINVPQGNPNLIWIGTSFGTVAYTTNGTAAAPTWTVVAGLPARYVESIVADANNNKSVYISFGGYVAGNLYHSADSGATWATVGAATLPAVPVNTITLHPTNSNWLYVGTDVGIFDSPDGGATWSTTNDGPANVAVDQLTWMDNSTLLAATHGRGAFKATIQGPPAAPTGVTATPGDGRNTIAWPAVTSATSYNIYWSTTAGVTTASGAKIAGVTSPYLQTGLTNGAAYYYVVTAVNAVGESVASAQVSATPSAAQGAGSAQGGGGGGGGGGCTIMAPGGSPDISVLMSLLVILAYWMTQYRRRARGEA